MVVLERSSNVFGKQDKLTLVKAFPFLLQPPPPPPPVPPQRSSAILPLLLVLFFPFTGAMAETEKVDDKKRTFEFDDVFEHIPSFGRYQRILYFSVNLLVFAVTNQFSALVFAFGTPGFHCVTPNITCAAKKCCDGCTSYVFDGPFRSTVSEVRTRAVNQLRS